MANEVILIVDDDDLVVEITQLQLEHAGFRSACAYNGEAAIEHVQANPPDLIMMDVSMGGMDGYETTRRLKADPATASIPVLLVTGFHGEDDIDKAVAAGVDDILFKPVNSRLMILRVKSLVRIKTLQDQLNG